MSAPTNSRKTPPRKTGPKVPKGWRRLRMGEIIRTTDKFLPCGEPPWQSYRSTKTHLGDRSDIGRPIEEWHHPHIRRQPRQRRK